MFKYIEERLRSEIDAGRISIVTDVEPWFDRIGSRFPTGINRIAWEKVANKAQVEVFSETRAVNSDELEVILGRHRSTIIEWFDRKGVDLDSEVVWLGDDTDVGLRMQVKVLVQYFPVLFSLPQHSYVLPLVGTWCMNYVMEGELFFGSK